MAISLAKLAQHYWRPDFSAIQAEMLFADFVEDLAQFSEHEVETSCRLYRQNGANQFFPKPGQLRDIAMKQRKEDATMARIGTRPLPESRPLFWWALPRTIWKAHWLESEVPHGERPSKRSPVAPAYSPGLE